MANEHFSQSNDPYWYPQLPDGYQAQNSNRHQQPIPVPHHHNPGGHHGGFPGHPHSSPSGQHGGAPGFSPPFNQLFPGFFPWQGGGGSGFPSPQQPIGNQAPQNPPPDWIPEYPSVQTRAIDPGAISRCMYRFTYVWFSRRQGFWFFPVFVGPQSVAGYRWNSRRRRWEYTGVDLNQINSFTCI